MDYSTAVQPLSRSPTKCHTKINPIVCDTQVRSMKATLRFGGTGGGHETKNYIKRTDTHERATRIKKKDWGGRARQQTQGHRGTYRACGYGTNGNCTQLLPAAPGFDEVSTTQQHKSKTKKTPPPPTFISSAGRRNMVHSFEPLTRQHQPNSRPTLYTPQENTSWNPGTNLLSNLGTVRGDRGDFHYIFLRSQDRNFFQGETVSPFFPPAGKLSVQSPKRSPLTTFDPEHFSGTPPHPQDKKLAICSRAGFLSNAPRANSP